MHCSMAVDSHRQCRFLNSAGQGNLSGREASRKLADHKDARHSSDDRAENAPTCPARRDHSYRHVDRQYLGAHWYACDKDAVRKQAPWEPQSVPLGLTPGLELGGQQETQLGTTQLCNLNTFSANWESGDLRLDAARF